MGRVEIFFFFVFIVLFARYCFKSYRSVHTEDSYLIADRSLPLLPLIATLVMTEFNTATLISFSGLGYLAGLRALFLPAIFLIALTFYALTVAKKWKELNGLSVAELFTKRYGSRFGKITSVMLICAMIGFGATYLKSLTMLFQPILPNMPESLLSLSLLSIILLLTLRGGLKAIVRFDIASFILVAFVMPMILFFVYTNSSSYAINSLQMYLISHAPAKVLPGTFIVSLILLTMFTYILAPWYGQKMFAARSPKVAKLAVMISAVIVFALYSCAIFATALLRARRPELASYEMALPHVVQHYLPAYLRIFAYLLFFTAAGTTLAGVWNAMSAMVVGDFLKKQKGHQRSIVITLLFALVTYGSSNLLIDNVFNKMILANIPIAALSFALLAGFYWDKVSNFGAYLSISVGLVWGTGCFFVFGEQEYIWYWAVCGIPLTFICGILGSLWKPNLEAIPLKNAEMPIDSPPTDQ